MELREMRQSFAEYLDARNRRDLDAICALVYPSVRRAHVPGGVKAWIADLADLFRGFPDWRWRRIQLVSEDDRLAAHLRGKGTHLGLFRGASPTRWHANIAEFSIYRVTNGLITEASSSADNRDLQARLEHEREQVPSRPGVRTSADDPVYCRPANGGLGHG